VETMLEDIQVMFVESPKGPAGARKAFDQLESGLAASLKGRKFYGTFQYSAGQYRACVALEPNDDPKSLGFEVWRIPGGKYARRKLENWTEHVDQIPIVFQTMNKEYAGRGDASRPSIEFYRSERELILLYPIL
jgi:hypothetical protein